MGAHPMGVAYTLDDGHLALVVELFQGLHIGVEAQVVVDGQDLLHRDPYVGPVVQVQGVTVGDDGVHAIVAPG